MEQELLAWAQVAVRELMSERCHLSMQTLLMVTHFESQPSTRAMLKNYLLCSEKPPGYLGVCRLYARAGLGEELRQAMQERPLSNSDMFYIVRAGARGGHWSIIEPYLESREQRCNCLFVAVKRGHLEILQRVLSYGGLGLGALCPLAQNAVRAGRVEIFEAVLVAIRNTANTHYDMIMFTGPHDVLAAAVESGDPEMVRATLRGMEIPFCILDSVAEAACKMPGFTAAIMCSFVECEPQLLNPLLVAACQKGNLEVAQCMLDHGASALDEALKACDGHRNLEVVEFLLNRGARDPRGYLVAYGGPQIAALMLRVGACEPQQALIQDALYFMPDILRLVLAAGPVDLEAALRRALTILPCQPRALGSVMVLVEAGARLPEGDPLYSQTLESCLRLGKSNSGDLPFRAAAVEYMSGLAGVSVHDALVGPVEVLAKDAFTRPAEVSAETQDCDFDY